MKTLTLEAGAHSQVFVIGAGIMGLGIAQVAAQAGHEVRLFDSREGAAVEATRRLRVTLDLLVEKRKLTLEAAQATLERIQPCEVLSDAASAALVLEAVVERLDVKRSLFGALEEIVAPECILASNTSSLSITALANGLRHRGRVVGMHFFNPVPQMKLCEVVSGLQTDPAIAEAIFALAGRWRKTAVHTRSTPGFIVNRIARPFYAETLALLQERAGTPEVLDACLRGAGFRMGPCELMDLIGHDTNFAVSSAVYEANFFDKRFVPSLVQRELVDGGLLGRKSGRGFYRYPEGAPPLPSSELPRPLSGPPVTVHGSGALAQRLMDALARATAPGDAAPARRADAAWTGLAVGSARLVMTDGRTAAELADAMRASDVAVFDRPMGRDFGGALGFALAPHASAAWRGEAPAWLSHLGFQPQEVSDAPGLVVARTIAMLINEAADAVLQGVCSTEDADTAMTLGVNYPAGPFEWLARWGATEVMTVLDSLDANYRGERYRVSPWLRRSGVRPG